MKDKERICNPAELMAEALMRLDNLEAGQKSLLSGQSNLDENMLELAKNQTLLSARQSTMLENMITLTQVVRKNSTGIEIIKETMSTKEGLNNLFELMMDRFDAMDNKFDKMDNRMAIMQDDINILKKR